MVIYELNVGGIYYYFLLKSFMKAKKTKKKLKRLLTLFIFVNFLPTKKPKNV